MRGVQECKTDWWEIEMDLETKINLDAARAGEGELCILGVRWTLTFLFCPAWLTHRVMNLEVEKNV